MMAGVQCGGVTVDLLVSYDLGRFGRAKREILDVLRRLGDEHAHVERSNVDGIALAHTALDAREVVRGCRSLSDQGYEFRFAMKWVPVDHWCDTDLDTIRKLLEDKVRDQIADNETWGMKVAKRRWEKHHSRDIVVNLARAIDREVDLGHPDKLVRVDVLGARTAVSVLHPGEIFSVRRYPSAATPMDMRVVSEATPGRSQSPV
jgi:tRNA(Ser,Leu) C12 N-acetylase TAN1